MMAHEAISPFHFKLHGNESEDEPNENKRSSTWLIAPYFMVYFITYIINFLVWPLLVMERLCTQSHGLKEQVLFSSSIQFNSTSCIDRFLTGSNFSNESNRESINIINNDTLNLMIIGSVASASLSLVSYFLIWKPTMTHCKAFAAFLPPICIICQCILFSYALTVQNIQTFKYIILSGVVLPSVHCNFQGIFLLFYRMTDDSDRYNFKQKREIVNTRVDLTHALIFVGIIFGGFVIAVFFDTSYSVIFVIQFTLSFLNSLYALMLAPISLNCTPKKKDDESPNEVDINEDSDTSSSEEEGKLLAGNARNSKDGGLLSNQGNLFSEAPMIFSETSHRKELIVIIELTIFTIAIIADANLSGPYLLQSPFELTLREYGYCIAAQGVSKTIGLLLIRIIIYFSPLKHSTLISIAALNYIIYYIVLAVIPSKDYVYVSLMINFFGGVAIPTLISFMKINFTDTIDTVLEISTICSLIATVGFSSLQYFAYMKTRSIFPGTIFLMTSATMVLGFVIVLGTYFSTTIKNKRRSKHYADQLLNDYQ